MTEQTFDLPTCHRRCFTPDPRFVEVALMWVAYLPIHGTAAT